MSRPRILGHAQRREACQLLAAGFPLGDVARRVGCSARTIQRELARSDDFRRQLHEAEQTAAFSPLEHLRRQARRNWRAAAWLLERGEPQKFAPRRPAPCRPLELEIACTRLIEAALQDATEAAERRRLFRRLQDVAEQACRDLMAGRLGAADADSTPLVDSERLSDKIDAAAKELRSFSPQRRDEHDVG